MDLLSNRSTLARKCGLRAERGEVGKLISVYLVLAEDDEEVCARQANIEPIDLYR